MADKALLLGINGYKSVSGLRGCQNDVKTMHELLTNTFGFKASNIQALLDTEVTKSRVRRLMEWIYEDTQPGDRLLLHFSGHGSYTVDQSGDEADNRDELICLYDMDFSNTDSFFIDDELRDWTRNLPADRQLVVVLDNCHSGTGTRKIVPPESDRPMSKHPAIIVQATRQRSLSRGLTRDLTEIVDSKDAEEGKDVVIARFIEPPLEIRKAVENARPRKMLREITPELNHMLLAGCRDDQTAADAYIDGQFHGAFTYHLCKILSSAGGNALSRHDLIIKLASELSAANFDQVPQLEAPSDQGPVFKSPEKSEAGKDESPTTGAGGSAPSGFLLPATPSDSQKPAPETPSSGAPSAEAPPAPQGGTSQASDLPHCLEELLAAYNRALIAGGLMVSGAGGISLTSLTGAPAEGRGVQGQKVLVYVHGICQHAKGYSNDWWAALSPFAPDLQPGNLGEPGTTNARRYEVLWSDLVRGAARELSPTEVSSERALREQETRQRIVEILEDRARQQSVTMAATQPERSGAQRALDVASSDRALLGIPGLDCINDFVQYLEKVEFRQRVQGRFFQVVAPLLRAGAQVEIISHSWGTVVAYESLCILENASPRPPGLVANLFTVGSALSIGYVKNRLIDSARDGHRPRMVRNWVNLDARGDVVGGPLRGVPFAVDREYLNLEPVGCDPHFPSPACAHGSYFNAANVVTNRDIFGREIAR